MYAVLKLSGSTTLALILVAGMGTVVESEADEHLEWLISKIVWSLNNDMDSWVAQLVPVEGQSRIPFNNGARSQDWSAAGLAQGWRGLDC